jgi:cardiolipin synthase
VDLKLFAMIASVMHLLGILSAIRAVMESRTPQGATAWALWLTAFPYVAVPAYCDCLDGLQF